MYNVMCEFVTSLHRESTDSLIFISLLKISSTSPIKLDSKELRMLIMTMCQTFINRISTILYRRHL